MALKPRNSVDDAYIDGLECAICTSTDLTVNHVSKYPDFVSCANCGSAFIVEHEGSWIMYGKTPSEYPETSEFALRQWTWLDAVRQRAEDERRASQEISPEPTAEAEVELEMGSQKTWQVEEEIVGPGSSPSEEAFSGFEDPSPPAEPMQELPEVSPYIAESEPLATTPIAESLITPQAESTPDPFEFPAPPPIEEQPSEIKQAVQDASMPFAEEPLHREQPETAISGLEEKADLEAMMESPSSADHSLDRLSTLMPETVPQVEDAHEGEYLEPITVEDPEELEAKFEIHAPVGEPAKGQRFKVIVKGSELNFPKNVCSHCLRTPVVLGVTVNGTLPDFKRPGARSSAAFRLPLCEQDKKRTETPSEAAKNALLQAHLISGVVAVFAMILFLVSGAVNPREELLLGGVMMILIAILGYGIPAIILLGRANRYPPTHDAAYVQTTLRVLDDLGDLETAFEWRNEGYAELFRQVNRQRAAGPVERVADHEIIPDPEPSEVPEAGVKPAAEEVVPTIAKDDVEFPEE